MRRMFYIQFVNKICIIFASFLTQNEQGSRLPALKEVCLQLLGKLILHKTVFRGLLGSKKK